MTCSKTQFCLYPNKRCMFSGPEVLRVLGHSAPASSENLLEVHILRLHPGLAAPETGGWWGSLTCVLTRPPWGHRLCVRASAPGLCREPLQAWTVDHRVLAKAALGLPPHFRLLPQQSIQANPRQEAFGVQNLCIFHREEWGLSTLNHLRIKDWRYLKE